MRRAELGSSGRASTRDQQPGMSHEEQKLIDQLFNIASLWLGRGIVLLRDRGQLPGWLRRVLLPSRRGLRKITSQQLLGACLTLVLPTLTCLVCGSTDVARSTMPTVCSSRRLRCLLVV